ncbi:MAG: radical SAM protein [Candidatus Nitrosocaldus sp.]
MKILLIYPRKSFESAPSYTNPKLGLMYLSSYVKKYGYKNIKIIDLDLVPWSFNTFCQKVVEYAPDIIGIQCLSISLEATYKICRFVRESLSNTKIVLGGPHFNSNPEEIFNYFDIDFVVHGEGEKTFLELVQSIRETSHYKNIKGLVFRNADGTVVKNERRELNHELDDLPFPDYEDLYEGQPFYSHPYSETGRMITMMTSRGCPFRCAFCDTPNIHGTKVRTRSVDNVLDEIKFLQKKYRVREFSFKDSNFHMSKKWVSEFADKIKQNNMDISFFANYRVDVINDGYAEPLKQAGCSLVFCGIESTDPVVQKLLGKNTSMEQMLRADESFKKYGIKRLYSFMFGSPGDTEESLKSSIDFAIKTNPFLILIQPTTAFPGTALYDYAVKHNLLKNPKWFYSFLLPKVDDPFPGRMMMEHLPPEKVNKYIRHAYIKFYLRPVKVYELLKYFKLKRFVTAIAMKFFSFVKNVKSMTPT